MNYTIEMCLGAMIYIPSFMKTGSDIQKLIEGDTHRDTQRERKVIS
jgi:hypothetical protein